jgi:AraC-like DNA-binding protein
MSHSILHQGDYYGNIQKKVQTQGVILTLSHYPVHTTLPDHFHENSYLCYVQQGSYREQSVSGKLVCEQEDIVFHPAGIAHSNTFPIAPASCFNIEIDAAWMNKFDAGPFTLSKIARLKSPALKALIHKMQGEFRQYHAWSGLMIEGLTLECMALFLREKAAHNNVPHWLRMIKELLHEQQEPVALAELAALTQMSPFHIVRAFKKAYGMSIGEYANQLKIERACSLLRYTRQNLAQIAIECNFFDQSHFGRIFKRSTGLTPLQYRKAVSGI